MKASVSNVANVKSNLTASSVLGQTDSESSVSDSERRPTGTPSRAGGAGGAEGAGDEAASGSCQ